MKTSQTPSLPPPTSTVIASARRAEASETASIEVKSEATVVYFDETEGIWEQARQSGGGGGGEFIASGLSASTAVCSAAIQQQQQ